MSEKVFKVKVQGPGISIEREVAEMALARLLPLLLLPDSPMTPEDLPSSSDQRTASNITIGEFLSDLNIRSNPERIAGIALFLREALDRETVARDELPAWFQRAGQPAPKNLIRDVKAAVAQRLIAEDHARGGEYLVTETGVRTLRGHRETGVAGTARRSLPGGPADRPSRGSSDKRATPTADGPTAKVQELVDDAWFASPRTVAELVKELAARGAHYQAPDLTYQMQQFVKAKKLRRKKEIPPGGKREVWHYSNW
jgi:hypothetical protein